MMLSEGRPAAATPETTVPMRTEAFPGLGLGAVEAGFPADTSAAELAVVHALIPFERSTAIIGLTRALAIGLVNQVLGDPLAAAMATRETVRLLEDAVSAEAKRRAASPLPPPVPAQMMSIDEVMGLPSGATAASMARIDHLIACGWTVEAAVAQVRKELHVGPDARRENGG